MRKANQEITDKAIIVEILQGFKICRTGTSDKGFLYVLPFNYEYNDNQIYNLEI
jgi:nitroimidazol reductase NimA-like FMN-containing flavoprotein (pyridoxamine 5'-phosphate oxidase superfamily)